MGSEEGGREVACPATFRRGRWGGTLPALQIGSRFPPGSDLGLPRASPNGWVEACLLCQAEKSARQVLSHPGARIQFSVHLVWSRQPNKQCFLSKPIFKNTFLTK
jgi:hypothetical protein